VIETLARWRVPLGFVFGLVVLWLAQPTAGSVAAGGLIGAFGEALRVWAAGHLNKAQEVTASGPYRFLAHPLYVGSSIMGAGLAMASGNLLTAVLIAAYLLATLTAAVKSEERFLRRTFGEQYEGYRRGQPVDGASRPFSWRQARANREHRTLAGFVLVVLLLAAKATYNASLG
jgi:hypothetical protein